MKVLLYCLFLARRAKFPALRGIDRRPVHFVSGSSLTAAMSLVTEGGLKPTPQRIRAYDSVVESLFEERAVVPMRYGSVLASRTDVAVFLKANARRFIPLLRELDGAIEMGIRVYGPLPRRAPRTMTQRAGPGRTYLQSRGGRSRANGDWAGTAEHYREALGGLFTRSKAEPTLPMNFVLNVANGQLRLSDRQRATEKADRGLFAMYFLVPKDRVAAFKDRFNHLPHGKARVEMTGPWPPYNFVAS